VNLYTIRKKYKPGTILTPIKYTNTPQDVGKKFIVKDIYIPFTGHLLLNCIDDGREIIWHYSQLRVIE